jgi:hypothetical protein
MEFQEFLTEQEKVYTKFRDASKTVETEGTKPNLPQNPQGGYLIAFRHPLEIAERIEAFSMRLAQTVPLMVYDAKTIHTTLSDYGIREDFSPDKTILDKLCGAVRRHMTVEPPKISYAEWLYNQNTMIIAGVPNSEFLQIANQVIAGESPYATFKADNRLLSEAGIKLRMPWGAHITAGRFTEQRTPKELSDFFKLIKEAPEIGEGIPPNIDVSYFNFSKEGFKLTTYDRFPTFWDLGLSYP